MHGSPWPRLSDTLPEALDPHHCQMCQRSPGYAMLHQTLDDYLVLWQECDDSDQPEDIYILLCRHCGDDVIEQHPRLYVERHFGPPVLGTLDLCTGCRLRRGLTCRHPQKATLRMEAFPPSLIFWDGTDENGDHHGGTEDYYEQPTACSGLVSNGVAWRQREEYARRQYFAQRAYPRPQLVQP